MASIVASTFLTLAPADAASPAGPAGTVQIAAVAKTRLTGWSTKAATVRLKGELGATVAVTPKAKRTISVQYRKRGTTKWLTQSRPATSSAGSAYVRFTPPAKGVWQVRLLVAATRSAGKLVTGKRVVTVKGTAIATRSVMVSVTSRAATGNRFAVPGRVNPPGVRRVQIQGRAPDTKSWKTMAVAISDKSGKFSTSVTFPKAGEWRLRPVVEASPTYQALSSSARYVYVGSRLRLALKGASGLALAPAGSRVATAVAGSAAGGTVRTSATEPTLVIVKPDGTLTNAIEGKATASRFLIAPTGDVYMLFSRRTDATAGGDGACLLARVDRSSGLMSCVDSTLAFITWPDDQWGYRNPAVQFDDKGAVYYEGWTDDGRTVLRRHYNGVTKNLINDAISLQDFLVAGDGSVFLRGSTNVTSASWIRRISPQGSLQTLSTQIGGNLLHQFPDGNVYIGLWDGSGQGVRRFLTAAGHMDPDYRMDVSAFCGPDDFGQAICSSNGASVSKVVTSDDGAVYAVTGGQVFQLYPTLSRPSTTLSAVTNLAAGPEGKLLVTGLGAGNANSLSVLDTAADTESVVIGAANEVETYRLHYLPSTNSVMFDGLRFADNTYVVGRVDLASRQVTTKATGSTRLVDFQTF